MNPNTTVAMALVLMTTGAMPIRATAQNDLKPSVMSNCPAPAAIQPIHLYGLWQAEFGNRRPSALMRLGRHPEWPDSVRGEVDLAGVKTRVAGDVEQGEFMLDESSDGQLISATWIGQVLAHSCGKEIQGTWTDTINSISTPFVLRKQPGWQ
jgi:hypothetical protein